MDLENKTDSKLVIKGRHDPCIVPWAIPVVEAAALLAALEPYELKSERKRDNVMQDKSVELLAPVRKEIDIIDHELLSLFLRRMKCSRESSGDKGSSSEYPSSAPGASRKYWTGGVRERRSTAEPPWLSIPP